MIIKIKQMVIENFKGIKHMNLEFDGNMNIFGDNATGKTTILDAFLWLLFDKNSSNDSKFSIKPLNGDGTEMHNLEHKVEVLFEIDGIEKRFTRIYKEVYTKKRGSTELVFTGHTSDYYIDDVPKSLKDYKEEVSSLADEEIFKMLTNLYYFNSNMDWKQRREVILKLSGEIDNADVIAKNPKLKPLTNLLEKKSVEDILEITKSTKSRLNKELKETPIKIQELSNITYDLIDGLNEKEVKSELSEAMKHHEDLIAKQSQSDTKSAELAIDREIYQLENEKIKLSNFKSDKQERLDLVAGEGRKLRSDVLEKKNKLRDLERKLQSFQDSVSANKARREELYKEYDEVNAQKFTGQDCSYCGQTLPVDKLEELEKQFNLTKASKLERIVNSGKELSSTIEEHEKVIVMISKDITAVNLEITNLGNQVDAKLKEYAAIEREEDVNPNETKILEIDNKIKELQAQKTSISKNSVNIYSNEIEKVKLVIADLNEKLATFSLKTQNDKRIKELQDSLKNATEQYEEQENLQILCEEFIITRASFLEERINNQFELVKFKLFEEQVNGGITETCVATFNGVPYSDLNHAMQVNAGLDIIQGLQKVYGVKAPIFIDNAESVTKFKQIDTQLIKLIVSEKDKKLRFEEEV